MEENNEEQTQGGRIKITVEMGGKKQEVEASGFAIVATTPTSSTGTQWQYLTNVPPTALPLYAMALDDFTRETMFGNNAKQADPGPPTILPARAMPNLPLLRKR